jgi:hypothetical protein
MEVFSLKTLRNPGKVDILLNLFGEVGDVYSVAKVCEITGISNYNSLKAFASYIRRAPHIADENRIDIRIKDDQCKRVG